jgi:hypothetical protein
MDVSIIYSLRQVTFPLRPTKSILETNMFDFATHTIYMHSNYAINSMIDSWVYYEI